jgi:hypothetical protein
MQDVVQWFTRHHPKAQAACQAAHRRRIIDTTLVPEAITASRIAAPRSALQKNSKRVEVVSVCPVDLAIRMLLSIRTSSDEARRDMTRHASGITGAGPPFLPRLCIQVAARKAASCSTQKLLALASRYVETASQLTCYRTTANYSKKSETLGVPPDEQISLNWSIHCQV